MVSSLPSRPSLEHLKKQAKSLLCSAQGGSPEAIARLSLFSGESTTSDSGANIADRLTLAQSQFVIAREYGFAHWAELKHHVELIELSAKSQADRITAMIQSCLDGDLARVERLLARYPELCAQNIHLATAVGDIDSVIRLLEQNPPLVSAVGGPLNAAPLVYACATRFAAPNHPREPNIVAIAGELLRRGADPNAFWLNPEYGNCRLSALYGAAGVNHHAGLTRLLLQAGANPNDGESLYHATEHGSSECVKMLLKSGATIAGSNAMHQAIACNNLAAVKTFLDHGANVNEPLQPQQSMSPFHWAIECGRDRAMLECLMAHGVDLRAKSADGLTPYRRAARLGHAVALELLRERGVIDELDPREEFLAACMAGDASLAKRLLAKSPDTVTRLSPCDRSIITAAAWRRNLRAVQTMLDVGFDVAWVNERQATALHCAAWQGDAAIVALLLAHHASCAPRETEFDCTPLEWAMHGSRFCQPVASDMSGDLFPAPDYPTIVAALLSAGSPAPKENLVAICRGEVEELLAAAGYMADEGRED